MLKAQKMSVDLRIVCLVLLATVVALVFLWSPWTASATKRTITISGEATQKAEPDEYQFSPNYNKKGTDRATIQKELADKINGIIAKLKTLGVAESDITLASSTYDNYYNDGSNEVTSNSLTVTVNNKDLSQKVQDYLLTTTPEGQITPYPTFSTTKRKKLEDETRSLAITDAKAKAQRTADELGAKLGKVVSISDQNNGIVPMMASGLVSSSAGDAKTIDVASLPVLSGKQDVSFTVQVVYEIK
jgi:uncharacterized protein YggE